MMALAVGYNSLENPIGIETRRSAGMRTGAGLCYNSLENPIGIETCSGSGRGRGVNPPLQLIRKPDRD